ncbi:T9SS type A sorting domain-containing protein [Candidatus Poribacteria bacterium]|nr:T9SS type A sorting domain-containing protein [Candidatus Poribacteria bacterium]
MWSKDDFSSVIETVAVSSDGSFVSVCCGGEDDNTIYLLDRAGNTLWSHTGIGNQVAISQDGESIAVSSRTSLHLLKRDSSIETIFSFEREEISEFQLALQEGINLISVPLDPSGAKNGKQWRLSDLIDFIGSSATMIIRYDKAEKKFLTYMPNFPETSPANTVVQGGEGYIVMMKEPAGVTFTGTAWDGMVSLDAGINLISVPLNPCEEWRLNDLMSFIGKDATMIIKYDKTEKKFVTHMPDFPKNLPANSMVQGGEGYIVMMSAPVTVAFTGVAWENTTAASPPLIASTLDSKVTPFFVVEGFVHQKETGVARNNVKVVVKNLNNGLSGFDITGTVGDDGRYVVTFADLEGNCAAQVGDVIEVIALEPTGAFSGEPIRYTIKANDIKVGNVSLGDLLMSPIPKISALLQNYPNPFNPETWIPYQLSEEGDVSITIYDVSGRLVRILQLGQKRADFYITKSKSAYWDGRDELGQKVASGVYFYTLRTRDFATTRKMVIVK